MQEQGKEMLESFALVCRAKTSADQLETVELMEPTIGLEPMTC